MVLSKQAKEVLINGVDSTEINKSLELLLYFNYKIIAPKVKEESADNTTWFTITIILLVLCIVLSFAPHTYLGIGKGAKKVKFRKTWLKVISFYIPISILLLFFINKLSDFI